MKGVKMKLIKNNNMDGTHLVGEVETTYKNLVEKFGPPHYDYKTSDRLTDNKISVEWSLRFQETNDVVTIYNWKDGKNYLGNEGDEVEDIKNWHIGGYSSKVVPMIKEVINK
jgi:hypothetical protein